MQQKEKGCVTGEMHGMLCIARVQQEKFRRTLERNNHNFAINVCNKYLLVFFSGVFRIYCRAEHEFKKKMLHKFYLFEIYMQYMYI